MFVAVIGVGTNIFPALREGHNANFIGNEALHAHCVLLQGRKQIILRLRIVEIAIAHTSASEMESEGARSEVLEQMKIPEPMFLCGDGKPANNN